MDPVEARFLRDIGQRPDDAETRLIYADWLEEQGQLGRASFLRAQLQLAQLAPGDPKLPSVARSLQALLPDTTVEWRTLVAQKPLENCTFVVRCTVRWEQLTPTADPAVRQCGECERPVHYVSTRQQLMRHAMAATCVAVDLATPRAPGDLQPPGRMIAPGIVAMPPPDLLRRPAPVPVSTQPPQAPSTSPKQSWWRRWLGKDPAQG